MKESSKMNRKRLYAYAIDYLIAVMILGALISRPFSKISDKQIEKANTIQKNFFKVTSEYNNAIKKKDKEAEKKASAKIDEYTKETYELSYTINKQNLLSKSMIIILLFVYYGIIPYFNKSQTIGKKFMKIKMLSKNDKDLILVKHIGRALILYGILPQIIMAVLPHFYTISSAARYAQINTLTLLTYWVFIIVETIFLFARKGNTLTDSIFNIKYVSEDEALI